MADYQLSDGGVTRTEDGAAIPADPKNRDWREYLEWLDESGVPDPIPEVLPPEPDPVAEAKALARHEAKGKAAKKLGLTVAEMDLLFGPNGDPIP